MINPRFVEAGNNSLSNEWLSFSRLHALMFWKKNILYSRIPGASCREIKKVLFRENGLSEGWPEEAYDMNDAYFAARPRDVAAINGSFAVVQHPVIRAFSIPSNLMKDRDGCASTWKEMTGRDWREFTMSQLLIELKKRKDLLVASHWWCPQELCLYLYPESYTRMFKQESAEDLTWWLGENGIQASSESLKNAAVELDTQNLPSRTERGSTPLGEIDTEELPTKGLLELSLDAEVYCLVQELYEVDARLYAKAI